MGRTKGEKGKEPDDGGIASRSARNALECVLDCLPGERLMVISDASRDDVASAFVKGSVELGMWTRRYRFPPRKGVRTDVPPDLNEILTSPDVDIYINLLEGPAEETPFRIKLIRTERRRKVRLGHCPGVTMDMLVEGALNLTADEYTQMQEFAGRLMARLSGALSVHVSSPAGTDLGFSVEGREFFTDTKQNWITMKWMNLPVGEVITAPVEDSLNGTLVCDSAIGGVGPIKQAVTITAEGGKAVDVRGGDRRVLNKVKAALTTCPHSSIVGEFAFGLNPAARVVEEFLETEKVGSTVHVAFGNNIDFPGGKNPAKNHMDLLITEPTVKVTYNDGRVETVVKGGKHTTK